MLLPGHESGAAECLGAGGGSLRRVAKGEREPLPTLRQATFRPPEPEDGRRKPKRSLAFFAGQSLARQIVESGTHVVAVAVHLPLPPRLVRSIQRPESQSR